MREMDILTAQHQREYEGFERGRETKRLTSEAVAAYKAKVRARLKDLEAEAERKRRKIPPVNVLPSRSDRGFLDEIERRPVKKVWVRIARFPFFRRVAEASANELMHRITREQR
jgi:hypothetical protein